MDKKIVWWLTSNNFLKVIKLVTVTMRFVCMWSGPRNYIFKKSLNMIWSLYIGSMGK